MQGLDAEVEDVAGQAAVAAGIGVAVGEKAEAGGLAGIDRRAVHGSPGFAVASGDQGRQAAGADAEVVGGKAGRDFAEIDTDAGGFASLQAGGVAAEGDARWQGVAVQGEDVADLAGLAVGIGVAANEYTDGGSQLVNVADGDQAGSPGFAGGIGLECGQGSAGHLDVAGLEAFGNVAETERQGNGLTGLEGAGRVAAEREVDLVIVADDDAGTTGGGVELGVLWAGELYPETFILFQLGIALEVDGDGFADLAGGEGQDAADRGVVFIGSGGAGRAAGILHADGLFDRFGQLHGQQCPAAAGVTFGDSDALNGETGQIVVEENGTGFGGVEFGSLHVAQNQAEGFIRFQLGIAENADRQFGAGLAFGNGEATLSQLIVGADFGGVSDGGIVQGDIGLGGAGEGENEHGIPAARLAFAEADITQTEGGRAGLIIAIGKGQGFDVTEPVTAFIAVAAVDVFDDPGL